MSGFPPAKGNSNATKGPNSNPDQMDSTPTSTGPSIADSLKLKAAGTKDTPGVDKNVNMS